MTGLSEKEKDMLVNGISDALKDDIMCLKSMRMKYSAIIAAADEAKKLLGEPPEDVKEVIDAHRRLIKCLKDTIECIEHLYDAMDDGPRPTEKEEEYRIIE